MDNMVRWIAKHKTLVRAISWIVIVVIFILVGLFADVPLWGIAILEGVLILVSYVGVVVCDDVLVKRALVPLKEQCDPYPFLREMEQITTYPNQKAVKILHMINYSAALAAIGDYQNVYMLLSSIYPDGCPGVTDMARFSYYNNFMDVHIHMGRYQDADLWYKKAVQVYDEMRNKAMKRLFDSAISQAHAEYCFRHQDYVNALRFMDAVSAESRCDHVNRSLTYARIFMAMGEMEKAKEKLEFVIQNGNKLYVVTEAKELLAKINMEEQ